MENSRKYIWSLYFLLWVYFIFFDSSYDQGTHIVYYLIIGWIPFLVLHFIWKKKTNNSEESLDKKYQKLIAIEGLESIVKVAKAENENKALLQQAERNLNDHLTKYSRKESYYDDIQDYSLISTDELSEYFILKDALNIGSVYDSWYSQQLSIYEEVNQNLTNGLSLSDGKELLELKRKELSDKFTKALASVLMGQATGIEMVKSLKKGSQNTNKEDILKTYQKLIKEQFDLDVQI